MKNLKKLVFFGMAFFLSVISIVIISIVLFFIFISSKYDCNIHGKEIFASPAGDWQAVQLTTGCPIFSIVGDEARWNTKVYLEKMENTQKNRYLIFENNSDYSISIKWISDNKIKIILNAVSLVKKSRRSVSGIDIDYSLSKNVSNFIDKTIKSANGTGQCSDLPKDGSNAVYFRSLRKFCTWAGQYTKEPFLGPR
ncbi:hypothetical protein ACOSOMT5_P2238 [Acidiphilium sp. MT5]